MNSKNIGEKTEAIILAHLIKKNYSVSLPFGDNQRYDMIVDKGDGKLLRGQCKTGKYKNGIIVFNACSIDRDTYKRENYKGQIEIFLVYCPQLDKIYEIDVNINSNTDVSLRVDPCKNNQSKLINWAKDFEI